MYLLDNIDSMFGIIHYTTDLRVRLMQCDTTGKIFNLFAKMNLKNDASAEWKIYMKNA